MSRLVALLATLLLAAALPATAVLAAPPDARSIVVSDAWTRPTAAGMPMGVAYFVVHNQCKKADAIVAATTPAAAHVEFHRTTLDGGVARMRPLGEIPVPAQGKVEVTPGGIHLMLVDLVAPLTAGARVPLVLELRDAGKVRVELAVENRAQ